MYHVELFMAAESLVVWIVADRGQFVQTKEIYVSTNISDISFIRLRGHHSILM